MKYGEVTHSSHPKHKLNLEHTEFLFKCDGCKEVGVGWRYKCAGGCDYDLHRHCALPSPSFSHPFYPKCTFDFFTRPPGPGARYCNACEKDVAGFMYHCKSCGFDLHPCCAKLPGVIDDGEIKLYLYQKVTEPCLRCGRKGRSWSYRSACKKYNFHVACVKEMLMENWQEKGKDLSARMPKLKGMIHINERKSKGKVQKCCAVAGMALQFVVSAVLGDPTALIAGIVGSLISK
ncbi:hypothetical protein NMG60_11015368 [Bertholletia excelsa]